MAKKKEEKCAKIYLIIVLDIKHLNLFNYIY